MFSPRHHGFLVALPVGTLLLAPLVAVWNLRGLVLVGFMVGLILVSVAIFAVLRALRGRYAGAAAATLAEAAPSLEPPATALDRRRFLVQLGAAGAMAGCLTARLRRWMLGGSSSCWSSAHASAVALPASSSALASPDSLYRIDIHAAVPVIDEKTWLLKLTGLLDSPVSLTLDDLRRYEPVVGSRWTGVSLCRLLADLRLEPSASHLKIRSADGFCQVISLKTIGADERIMLAYARDGLPLTAEQGFPLCLRIPEAYGMAQSRWIESVEVTDRWEPGYTIVWGEPAEAEAPVA